MATTAMAIAYTTLAFAALANAMSVLLPMYASPTSEILATITNAAANHPHTTFYTIVNPQTGPGPLDADGYPSQKEYLDAIAALNKHMNIHTLGYVHVGWAKRSPTEVNTEVNQYAHWATHKGADIRIHGIFFDEAPHDNDQSSFDYMQKAAKLAHDKMRPYSPVRHAEVIFNPGTAVPERYFSIADMIMWYESPAANYQGAKTLSTIPKGHADQTAVTVNTCLMGADIEAMVKVMHQAGVEAAYFSHDLPYKELSLLDRTADAVTAMG